MLSRLSLVASVVVVLALLAARAALVPVTAFRERQWSLTADGSSGVVLRETRTRWARVVSETDATLARPGDLRIEWHGFLTTEHGGALGVVAESAGPAAFDVDGRPLARVPGGLEPRSSGSLPVVKGPHALTVRVDVPSHGGFFRAIVRLPDGRAIPLEKLDVTPSLVDAAAAERAQLFRRWGNLALAVALLLTIGASVVVLRRGEPRDLRFVEAAASALVLGVGVFVPHGEGLDFWGTFSWGGLGAIPRVLVLLVALLPWLAVLRARPVPLPRVSIPPLAAALAALVALWLLRERRFWGDAWITLRILEGRASEGPFGPFFWKEPLDRIVAVIATRAAALVGAGAAEAIAFTSCLAGALLACATFADRRRRDRDDWMIGAALTTGAMLVFFGHVENYAWTSAATVMCLLFATRAAAGETAPVWAGVIGGLAIAFHPIAVFAVAPALLALAALRPRPRDVLELAAATLLPMLALLLGCFAAGIAPPVVGLNRFADDPAVFRSPAAVLAPAALFSLANRLSLLLSPGVLLALLASAARLRKPPRETMPLVAAAAGGLACLVFLQGKIRPEAMDWDLYAPAAFPLAMLAGRALGGPGFAATRIWCTGVSAAVLGLGVLGNLRG